MIDLITKIEKLWSTTRREFNLRSYPGSQVHHRGTFSCSKLLNHILLSFFEGQRKDSWSTENTFCRTSRLIRCGQSFITFYRVHWFKARDEGWIKWLPYASKERKAYRYRGCKKRIRKIAAKKKTICLVIYKRTSFTSTCTHAQDGIQWRSAIKGKRLRNVIGRLFDEIWSLYIQYRTARRKIFFFFVQRVFSFLFVALLRFSTLDATIFIP